MPAPMLHALLSAVPSRCSVCGRWPAEPVCSACRARFAPEQARCRCCALPVPAGVTTCGTCVLTPPPLDACHAGVAYGYPWAQLLARYKFQDDPGWAALFAGLLRSQPGVQDELDQADAVVPMPLAPARLAQRGFNQAQELARRLAPGKADAHLLLRVRDTPPQVALGRTAREANVRGAFAPEPGRQRELHGKRVVLVDDVMTSGASLHAAAGALRAAGAVRVSALVAARTDVPA
jgi:ComF family protein